MNRRHYLALAGGAVVGTAGCLQFGSEPQTTTEPDAATDSVDGTTVTAETVATGLEVPWGAAVHDGAVYLTERTGRVVRLVDGEAEQVADLSNQVATGGEGGLLGLAVHPDGSSAFTYQTYRDAGSRWNRVVRHDLGDWAGETVLDGIPGARIHDGGRLLVHDGALYVTAGDASMPASAQNRDARSGKIHRLTLDGEPHPDNPFGTTVFTWGHRNPQGLAPASDRLYATEHGPDTDDEVNLLEAGNNYGWPEVRGTEGGDRFTPAISAFTPTIAPGGATMYPADGPIEPWRGDLLFGTLVGTHLHRTRLADGAAVGETRHFEGQFGRLRTTFVGPDGHLTAVTSNRDGRGRPREGDDRVIRFRPT